VIVVDTNVLGYLWVPGERTEAARAVLRSDPEWSAPLLWRSEFRNLLATLVRTGKLEPQVALAAAHSAEAQMENWEHAVSTEDVLRLAGASGCSAYDCEFVALAEALGVRLVTADRKVLRAFPGLALGLEEAVGGSR
jgi:predicted nucleic acid-binding protein